MTRALRSNWLDLALAALVAVAEAATVAPWLYLIAGLTGHPLAAIPSPVGLALVGLICYWEARYFLTGGWDLSAARAMSLGSWLVLMIVWFGIVWGHFISAPWHFLDHLIALDGTLIAIMVAGAVAWWRAISIASVPKPFTPEFARRLIWRGVLVSGLALVFSWAMHGAAATRVTNAAALAFPLMLVASLLAAGASQARTAREAIKSGADPVRVGLGTASGLTLGMILLAVAVAGLAGRHFWSQLVSPLRVVQHGLEAALYGILVVVTYALFILLFPFFWLMRHLIGNKAPQQPQAQVQAGKVKELTQNAHNALPHFVTVTLELILLAAIVGFVFWLILRSLRRYRGDQEEEGVDEIHESVWSSDLALKQLRSLLQGWGSRGGSSRRRQFDLDAEPLDVRDAYRHLLVLGDLQGQARQPNESPSDYLARLRMAWATAGEPLDDLTLRYLAARYAEESSEEDVSRARQDWRSLRGLFSRG